MKKRLLSSLVITFSFCLLSFTSVAQREAGGSTGGESSPPNPDLVINLGAAGTVEIPATSSYYSFVVTLLNYFHVTVAADGTVAFPTSSCYTSCISTLYYTRCINYSTYRTACSNPPSGCH